MNWSIHVEPMWLVGEVVSGLTQWMQWGYLEWITCDNLTLVKSIIVRKKDKKTMAFNCILSSSMCILSCSLYVIRRLNVVHLLFQDLCNIILAEDYTKTSQKDLSARRIYVAFLVTCREKSWHDLGIMIKWR